MRNRPKKPPGLLDEYLPEPDMAAAIGVATKTLIAYRKRGVGPPYSIVGRRIIYSRAGGVAWLAAGGLRAPDELPVRARSTARKTKRAKGRVSAAAGPPL